MRNTVAELRRRLARLELDRLASAGALDCLQLGVIVADRAGVVLHANRTARSIAERTNRPLLVSGTREHRIDTGWFRGVVTPLFRRISERGRTDPVVVTVPTRSGGPPLQMLVTPLLPVGPPATYDGPPAVVIFLSDPSGHIDTSDQMLRSLFALTKTEARVAHLLVQGMATRETAARLGMSPATARWHVKHLLLKTGTRSQRQLACVLLAGVASVRQD